MDDFGAIDRGDGAGKTIRYQDFVIAVDTVAGRHPLQINSGRYIMDLKARYMQDVRGRRLCTPGRLPPLVLQPREIKSTPIADNRCCDPHAMWDGSIMACLGANYDYTDAVHSRLRKLSKRRQPRASWMFQWRMLLPQRVWDAFAQRPQKCNVVEVCGEGAALRGAMMAIRGRMAKRTPASLTPASKAIQECPARPDSFK